MNDPVLLSMTKRAGMLDQLGRYFNTDQGRKALLGGGIGAGGGALLSLLSGGDWKRHLLSALLGGGVGGTLGHHWGAGRAPTTVTAKKSPADLLPLPDYGARSGRDDLNPTAKQHLNSLAALPGNTNSGRSRREVLKAAIAANTDPETWRRMQPHIARQEQAFREWGASLREQ